MKKESMLSRVAAVVNQLLDQEAKNPGSYYDGCWVLKKGQLDPDSFITFFTVRNLGDKKLNRNTINRSRQKALIQRQFRLEAERSRQVSGQVA